MKDSKNIVIGLLCAVVCVMAVAYAAFATTLDINGTASIDSTWNVAITAINCSATPVKGGEALDNPSATVTETGGTSATFNIKLKQPGDSATCTVTITNGGSLNAVVQSIDVSQDEEDNDYITYEVSGISQNTKLIHGETNAYTITATFPDTKEDMPSNTNWKDKTLTVTIDYVQDLATQ